MFHMNSQPASHTQIHPYSQPPTHTHTTPTHPYKSPKIPRAPGAIGELYPPRQQHARGPVRDVRGQGMTLTHSFGQDSTHIDLPRIQAERATLGEVRYSTEQRPEECIEQFRH